MQSVLHLIVVLSLLASTFPARAFQTKPLASPLPLLQSPIEPNLSVQADPLLQEETDSKGHAQVKLSAEPAIYIPGSPIHLSWSVSGVENHDTPVSLAFHFPEGIQVRDTKLETQADTGNEWVVPIPKDQTGVLVLEASPKAIFPLMLSAVLHVEGEKEDYNADAVYLDTAKMEASRGKSSVLQSEQENVRLDIPTAALSEDLLFDIRPPSPNQLPTYSLSTQPVEVIAVGKNSHTNVTRFNQPVKLQIQYNEKTLPSSWPEQDLQIFYFNEDADEWFPMETQVDAETNTLTTQTDHLTVFDFKASSWQGFTPPTMDSFQTDKFTGAGTYSLPLWTPPGSGGLQPKLTLNYNSQVIDEGSAFTQASWVGSGWSLDTGAIIRNMHGTNSDLSDDTFSIQMGGMSGQLLQVGPASSNVFKTADQSFLQVTHENTSEWIATTPDGTVYTFGLPSKTNKTDGCAAASSLDVTWRWSLTSVTDIHGNTITYTYYEEAKGVSNCANEIAVYPDTITYANGKYRAQFVREDRQDYASSWEELDSRVLFGRKRLQKVEIQKLIEGGSWATIRTYTLTYSNDEDNQIYPNFKWRSLYYTTTLVKVTETGADTTALETQFYYDDDQHLTKVNNGQGGEIEFTYTRRVFYDDVNHNLRDMVIHVGVAPNECGESTSISPWLVMANEFHCAATTPRSLEGGSVGAPSIARRGLPQYMIKPGARYNVWIEANNPNAGDARLKLGFVDLVDPDNPVYAVNILVSGFRSEEEQVDLPANFDPRNTRLLLQDSGCQVKNYTIQLMLTYYVVTSRTVRDLVRDQINTTQYGWDNISMNTNLVSDVVDSSSVSKLYVPPLSEYRGRSMVQTLRSDGYGEVTWFHQDDVYKGRPYHSLGMERTFYEAFEAETIDPSDWTIVKGTGSVATDWKFIREFDKSLKAVSTTSNWTVGIQRSSYNLSNGQSVIGHFRLNGDSSQTVIGLAGSTGHFFGLRASDSGLWLRTDTGAGAQDQSQLLSGAQMEQNKWYVFMIIVGEDGEMRLKVWQLSHPEISAESTWNGFGTQNWKLYARVNQGTLWLDSVIEGRIYTENETRYENTIQYDTRVDNGIPQIVGTKLLTYKDLAVKWIRPSWNESRSYEGVDFTGTKVSYLYEEGDQGGNQYGNLTRTVYAKWDGTNWVNHHATHQQFYPSQSGSPYRVNYLGRQTMLDCSGSCDFSGETGLIGETLFYYDDASAYNVPPTTGRLTRQRTRINAAGQYRQVDYAYGDYGNPTSLTTYNQYATATTSPSGGARSTSYTYDTYYGAYRLTETNALGHTITTAYDDTVGLPTKVIDANGDSQGASYDGLGRMKAVCAAPDWDGSGVCSPSNGASLTVQYIDYSFVEGNGGAQAPITTPFHVLLTQKLDERWMQKARFYSGLGQLIQTQTLNANVNGSTTNVVDSTIFYDAYGRVTSQKMPSTYEGAYRYSVESELENSTQTSYDILGRVTSVVQPNGSTQLTSYDGLTVTTTDANNQNTVTTYDEWGQVVAVNAADGPDLTYTYNTAGMLTDVYKGTLHTQMVYDLAGRKTIMSDPDMGTWVYNYDALDNLTSQTDARGCVTSLSYDDLSRLTAKSYAGPGACDDTPDVQYVYDGGNFSFLGINHSGGSHALGRRTGMTDGTGATKWDYDARGRVVSELKMLFTNPEQTSGDIFTTAFSYNSADLVTSITYPDGEVVAQTYNAQGLLEGMANTDDPAFTYINEVSYDEAGRATLLKLGRSGSNAILQQAFSYYDWNAAQDGGRLASLTSTNLYGAALQGLGYDYDNSGNILGITDSLSGEISEFTYDALERLLSMTVTVNGQTSHSETFSYADPHGRMVSKSLNGVSKAFTYDANHPHAAASLGDNSYTYDLNGSQVGRVIGSTAYTLTYDGENRMIRMEPVGGMAANSVPARRKVMALQFAPTPGGDVETPAPVFTFTPTLTRTPTPTATATLTPLPTGTATATPEPSPTGTAAPTLEPTQTPDLPPTETPTPTPQPPPLESAQYFYDGDGTLVKSIVNGEVTYYVSRQFHLRVSGEETRIQKYYPFGGQPIAVRTQANGTDTLNWLLTDHLGSAQVTAAEGGAASGVQRYSAFGGVRSRGGEMPTAYQYTGQLSQMEQVGLYHYGARWFDPAGAHFTQADTLIPNMYNPLDVDRYAYGRGNPLKYTDPTGHMVADDDRIGGVPEYRDLTEWIVKASVYMANDEDVQEIKQLLSMQDVQNGSEALARPTLAMMKFYKIVKDGARFDVKDQVLIELGEKVKLGDAWFEYSTTGNFLYGFYGAAAGFDLETLHMGAGAAQAYDHFINQEGNLGQLFPGYLDTPDDYSAVNFGFELYQNNYLNDNLLTSNEFRQALQGYKDSMALVSAPSEFIPRQEAPYEPNHFDHK